MRDGLPPSHHIMSAGSPTGALALVLICVHGPYQVGGALRKCERYGNVYCEATDTCDFWTNCDSIYCPGDALSCDGGTTCYSFLCDRCDGVQKCTDGADEFACKKTSPDFDFSCDNGTRCYSSVHRCDRRNYCTDGADEVDCPLKCFTYTCRDNTNCYGYKERCNGVNDCPDGSDENGCPSSDDTAGLSTLSIVSIVFTSLSVCAFCCKLIYWKFCGSPQPSNRAANSAPQSSDHQSTSMLQPEVQPSVPSVDDRGFSIVQMGILTPPQPSASSAHPPPPSATDITTPPPSYASLYTEEK